MLHDLVGVLEHAAQSKFLDTLTGQYAVQNLRTCIRAALAYTNRLCCLRMHCIHRLPQGGLYG